MAVYVSKNGSLQTVKGIYYGMTEDYINETLFHNLVPKTATEIRFLYASDNPNLTDYQRIGYCDNNNFIEVWNSGTKYILINPRNNYIYAPVSCYKFLFYYRALIYCVFDNFKTDNVTSMKWMFYNCSKLTRLDLSNFNTANVTDMGSMFYKCSGLTSLDLSNFKTDNVTNANYMFYICSGLTSLDVSNFKTDNVTNMYHIFDGCSKLTRLDLSSFNTGEVFEMSYMFNNCRLLTTIISNTFNKTALKSSNNMFTNCNRLVGGNGTTYSSSHINAEYARVDGENNLPGYFTAPTN